MNPQPAARERVLGAAALAAGAGYLLTALATMALHGLDQPMFDQYRQYVALIEQPWPDALLVLDNGHRPVLPALVRWLDLHVFGGGQSLANTVALIATVTNALLLATLALRARGPCFATRAALAAGAALALGWLGNARMLIQGSEAVNVQLIVLALILGALALHRLAQGGSRALAWAAAAAALLATFTFGPGIAAFPALGVVGLALRLRGSALLPLGVGLALALLLYLYGLPGDEGVRGALRFAPLANLRIATQWLAGPWVAGWLGLGDPLIVADWARSHAERLPQGWLLVASARQIAQWLPVAGGWLSTSALLGSLGLALLIPVAVRAFQLGANADPLAVCLSALALFGACCAALIGLTRLPYFESAPLQLYADRYLPWTCLYWFGVLGALVWVAGRARTGAPAALGVLVLALGALPTHLVQAGWSASVYWHAERLALSIATGVPDPAVMPHPDEADAATVARTAGHLRTRGLAMFRGHPERALGTQHHADALPAPAQAVLHAETYADAFTGRAAIYVHGQTQPGEGLDADTRLVVVDETGTVVGLGRLGRGRPGWTAWSPQQRQRLSIDAYARAPEACGRLRLITAERRLLGAVDTCGAPPR